MLQGKTTTFLFQISRMTGSFPLLPPQALKAQKRKGKGRKKTSLFSVLGVLVGTLCLTQGENFESNQSPKPRNQYDSILIAKIKLCCLYLTMLETCGIGPRCHQNMWKIRVSPSKNFFLPWESVIFRGLRHLFTLCCLYRKSGLVTLLKNLRSSNREA